jgi:copper chaperone
MTTYTVTGMTCGGCERAVKKAVARATGVNEADLTASHADDRLSVPDAAPEAVVRAAVEKAGYGFHGVDGA